MPQGRIAGLFVYPVKGCRGIALDEALLEPAGLAFDRSWLIVRHDGRFLTQRELPALVSIVPSIQEDGLVLRFGGSDHVVAPDPASERIDVTIWRDCLPALAQVAEIDRALSDHLGRPVRLVCFDPAATRPCDPSVAPPGARTLFTDGFPLLLTSATSLARLNDDLQRAGAPPVPMERFRPNLVIDELPAWAEDHHPHAEVGAVRLALVSPCERCIVSTTDQATGERRGQEPIRTLRRVHADTVGRPLFGWNVVPLLDGDPAQRLRIGDVIRLRQAGPA